MINLIKTESQLDSSSQTSESSSDDQLLLIEESSSNESNESPQSSCDCVENCLCHVKQVNVITSHQNFLIELIEKIPDQNLQKEYVKKYLEIHKQSNERSLENTNQYSLKTVLDQFSKPPKPIGIQDLQNEISQIKFQINTMLIQNQDLETRLKVLEQEKIQTSENSEDKQLEEGESSQLFINTITRMITQKWHIKVKLFIKLDFSKEFVALVDSSADINCVQEGLIPTVYFKKTLQGVVSANTQPLQIYLQNFKCTYL